MNDTAVIRLGKAEKTIDKRHNDIIKYVYQEELICEVMSITQNEFYLAAQSDLKPEIKFKLSDYLDYSGEKMLMYNDQEYEVIRTYRSGDALEIVAQRYGGIH